MVTAHAGPVTVAVVGSTGSIGTQTLDVVRRDPSRYEVVALGAQRSADRLAAQAHEFRPRTVAIGDPDVRSATEAVGLITETAAALPRNPNETLLVQSLFVRLAALAA